MDQGEHTISIQVEENVTVIRNNIQEMLQKVIQENRSLTPAELNEVKLFINAITMDLGNVPNVGSQWRDFRDNLLAKYDIESSMGVEQVKDLQQKLSELPFQRASGERQ